jgi:hypothetical protein
LVLVAVSKYAQAVCDAKQIDITKASPERFAEQIKASYPFHFAIRDLSVRFRENPLRPFLGCYPLVVPPLMILGDAGSLQKMTLTPFSNLNFC